MRMQCGTKPVVAISLAAAAAFASLPILAGVDIATSEAYGEVLVDTSGKPIALSSLSDVEAFAARPVTYREGETVTALAPSGSSVALVASPAAAAGNVSFEPTAGGLWRLVNSSGDNVAVGVAWAVFGEEWSEDFASPLRVRANTTGDGPNRKAKPQHIPLVAYSGDDWVGDLDAASSVTFVSPSGEETSFDLTGTGAFEFSFNKEGSWKVRLEMEDDSTREATIVVLGGFVLSFR